MAFWIRNDSGGNYTINDLGITIPTAEEKDLRIIYYYDDLQKSVDLIAAFGAGDLVRLDGPGGVPVAPGTEFDDAVSTHNLEAGGHTGNLGWDRINSINAELAEKLAPVNADVLVLEDSAGGWAKKKVQVGNLPGGGGSGPGADMKGNHVLAASFAGNPKVASVAFVTPYVDANYSISLGCITSVHVQFMPSVENKAAGGFDINMGCNNINGLVAVTWSVAPYGEA